EDAERNARIRGISSSAHSSSSSSSRPSQPSQQSLLPAGMSDDIARPVQSWSQSSSKAEQEAKKPEIPTILNRLII
ncbi:hypothetical protein PoB_004921700, partial [Plakobranchus ocellatus]